MMRNFICLLVFSVCVSLSVSSQDRYRSENVNDLRIRTVALEKKIEGLERELSHIKNADKERYVDLKERLNCGRMT